MDYTLFWTQFFAIYLVIMGISLYGRKKDMLKMMVEFRHSTALLFIASIVTIFLGSTIILTHNIWEGGLATFVTLMGWLILLKGALYAWAPQQLVKIGKPMVKGSRINIWATITLIIGLYLGYLGFFIG